MFRGLLLLSSSYVIILQGGLRRNGSVVEHVLGKDGVEGPIPSCGTLFFLQVWQPVPSRSRERGFPFLSSL